MSSFVRAILVVWWTLLAGNSAFAVDACEKASSDALKKVDEAYLSKIDLWTKVGKALQDKGIDPRKSAVVTPDKSVETIDILDIVERLDRQRADAYVQIRSADDECNQGLASPQKATDVALFFSTTGLSAVLPPQMMQIDASQILSGSPLGGPNALIRDVHNDIQFGLGADNDVAHIIRDPWLGFDAGPGPNDELAKMRALRDKINALPKGNIVLNAPEKMVVGDTRTVSARVGVGIIMERLRTSPQLGSQAVEGELRVSSDMVAALVSTSGGIEIVSKTPERQSVAEGLPTEWLWQIAAKKDGEQELSATLYALVFVGDVEKRERIESYTQKITIAVRPPTWGEWLKSTSEDVSSVKAIFVALGGAVTAVVGWFGWAAHRRKRTHKTVSQTTKGRRRVT